MTSPLQIVSILIAKTRHLTGRSAKVTIAERPTTIYTPEPALRNPGKFLHSMIRDLCMARELAWRLFLRNVNSQYRQSFLGYSWAVFPPLFITLVFVLLANHRILNIGRTNIPYSVYVLIGSVLWQAFVEALYCPLKLTISSKSILIKVNFSREALMLAGVAEVLVAFSIRMVLMLAAFAWFHVNFAPTMILGVFVALVLVALGFNLGVLLAPIGVLYHDVERALAILTVTWFFVTPVVYPVPSSWPASTLARINPVTPLLATARELFAGQAVSQIEGFFIVTCLTLCLTFAGLVLYRVSLPHIIERMGG